MTAPQPIEGDSLSTFVDRVLEFGAEHYRDFPWRRTRDPYHVLVSEVMLQQTQVTRVVSYYEEWIEAFPTLEALSAAPLEVVLQRWRGLGYNRRAIALKRAAEWLARSHIEAGESGEARVPSDEVALLALPGVGPATAAAVRAFAFGEPAAYLETNVRTVVLHEFMSDRDDVPDREVAPLVAAAAVRAQAIGVDPRTWNYALLDYGAYLKKTLPNPSRRSAHHQRQSRFEGSKRQRRAALLRAVLDAAGMTGGELADATGFDLGETEALLCELAEEGFIVSEDDSWRVA